MSDRKYRIPPLTELEYKALRWMIGNAADYPDTMDSLFDHDPEEKKAAYRAVKKVDKAKLE